MAADYYGGVVERGGGMGFRETKQSLGPQSRADACYGGIKEKGGGMGLWWYL